MDRTLERVCELFGTPAYVYFLDTIYRRVEEIERAFGGRFAVSYAVKCNPNPELLRRLESRVAMLDVSSIGEFGLGLRGGWDASRISFTGPGKRDFELREAIQHRVGELVVESLREARIANQIALGLGTRQPILVRIAPSEVPKGFGDHMAGRPVAFGIDVEVIDHAMREIGTMQGLFVEGLHIYSGTQCLKNEALAENYGIFIEIFRSVCERHGIVPKKLVFGSGIGIPYHDNESEIDLDMLARLVNPRLDELKETPRFRHAQCVLETGRFLVGEAGIFLTQVISKKESRGVTICICDGGMNNHLPASGHFGMVIQRNYRMHKLGDGDRQASASPFHLVGPLCTSIDRLGNNVMFHGLEEGDVIAIESSGAYGLTASPLYFISHPLPAEVLVDRNQLVDISRTPSDLAWPEISRR